MNSVENLKIMFICHHYARTNSSFRQYSLGISLERLRLRLDWVWFIIASGASTSSIEYYDLLELSLEITS